MFVPLFVVPVPGIGVSIGSASLLFDELVTLATEDPVLPLALLDVNPRPNESVPTVPGTGVLIIPGAGAGVPKSTGAGVPKIMGAAVPITGPGTP